MRCISGTYFDFSILVDDKRIELDGYNLIMANHTNNTRTGGVCIYYKEFLVIKVLDVHFNNFYYAKVQQKTRNDVCAMYRSSSQNNEFDEFLHSFENLPNNIAKSSPLLTVILGDFNARSTSWWVNDKTTIEGAHLEVLTTLHGFKQLTLVPTHLKTN